MGLMFPKSRPRALSKQDRQRNEDRLYRQNREKALARDGHRCRLCGSHRFIETHHMAKRSSFGSKRVHKKHAVENLLTVCGPEVDPKSCHWQIEHNVVRVYATTECGTNGPVRAEKWDDNERGYVVVREAA